MTDWALLAPGPSASKELAESLRGQNLGVVGNAFQLAPWADFLAATDGAWWKKHPESLKFEGKKFAIHTLSGTTRIRIPVVNSGVLALECAFRQGATKIRLYGFDMHGTHFFGPYTNGLKNTTDKKRKQHIFQYTNWGRSHKKVEVINCTPGSALKCFPFEESLAAAS